MKLNKEQYVAAHHVSGPMLVLAGPGSGKTHLLVERITLMIEKYAIPPDNILVITFSRKAARQMRSRFEKRVGDKSYPVTFGTFHAVFYHILRKFDPNINRLITEEEVRKFIGLALKKCTFISDIFASCDDTDIIAGMISGYKNFGEDLFLRDDRAKDLSEDDRGEFKKLLSEYDRLCRSAGVLDFDDMILLCHQMLYKHESVLRRWQDIYRYILVDEFQDINDGQYNVLRLLAGDRRNVFAVGDDDQSIYAFRGARPELMKKFLHQYIGCRQVVLTMNYRCCENVIGAADTVIRNNTDRLERPMQRHLPSKHGGTVEIVSSENTTVQAAYVCDMITALTTEGTYRPQDIAVLYRSAHCATMFEKTAEEYGISLKVTGDVTGPSRGQKIREAYKRAHDGVADRSDFFLIMNNPPRGLSREALCYDTGNYMADLKAYYKNDLHMMEKVRDLEDMIRQGDGSSVFADECTRQWDGSFVMSGDGNSDECPKTKEAFACSDNQSDRINVMTAHASKGLEFSVVFVIGLQEGLFPHYKSMDETGIREERRLMYVAMTRAKERLYLCTVGTEHGKRPSRFAAEASEKMKYINDIIKLTRW